MNIVDRFLNYVKIDTTSFETSETIPSNLNELKLGALLRDELQNMGLKDAFLDDKGIVYAHLEGEGDMASDGLGLIAHLDTSNDMKGSDIKPLIIHKYAGEVITLNEKEDVKLDPKIFPDLLKVRGDDLIVTDGTTLLGADDKAGIAAIMDMLEYLLKNPKIKHRPLAIAFTPDEEIGRGVDHFDLDIFGVKKAYTIDGGEVAVIEYENFNAASCKVRINGKSIHPGSAKGKMLNSQTVAMEFDHALSPFKRPECTEGYEGFYHLIAMEGTCEHSELDYILREHDKEKFKDLKEDFIKVAAFLNQKYGEKTVELEIKDSYYNMKDLVLKRPELINEVKAKMKTLDLEPKEAPIRGGTDGAMLTYRGLPCPNLGAGGFNFHGKYEFLSIDQLKKASLLLRSLVILD